MKSARTRASHIGGLCQNVALKEGWGSNLAELTCLLGFQTSCVILGALSMAISWAHSQIDPCGAQHTYFQMYTPGEMTHSLNQTRLKKFRISVSVVVAAYIQPQCGKINLRRHFIHSFTFSVVLEMKPGWGKRSTTAPLPPVRRHLYLDKELLC